MRQTISGLLAAFAVVTTAVPALACGGGLFTSSCAPCGQAYVSPCAQRYDGGYYHHSGYHAVSAYERLPYQRMYEPSPQYFYADQGPTFSGPGLLAPVPTYQESAVSGWGAYRRGYYYGYDGGRYANATNHDYDGAPAVEGPAIYSYRVHPHFRPWRSRHYGYGPHSEFSERFRYGYAPHHRVHVGAYYFAGPRHDGHPVRLMRRDD
jgi:hypothetical protein